MLIALDSVALSVFSRTLFWRANTIDMFRDALAATTGAPGVAVIVVPVDRESRVGGYDSWWKVPVAEVSSSEAVRDARTAYDVARRKERDFL